MTAHEEVAARVKEQVLSGNVRLLGVDFHADFERGLYVVTVKVKLRGYPGSEAGSFEHEVYLGSISEENTAAQAVAYEWRELLMRDPVQSQAEKP